MAYTPQPRVDGDPTKPINAAYMARIENGLQAAAAALESVQGTPSLTRLVYTSTAVVRLGPWPHDWLVPPGGNSPATDATHFQPQYGDTILVAKST